MKLLVRIQTQISGLLSSRSTSYCLVGVRKTDVFFFTFHGFAVVKQRVAVTFQPHQSSKHLSINNKLPVSTNQVVSDPGSSWSYIDHVLEEVEPGSGTDLISVVEK